MTTINNNTDFHLHLEFYDIPISRENTDKIADIDIDPNNITQLDLKNTTALAMIHSGKPSDYEWKGIIPLNTTLDVKSGNEGLTVYNYEAIIPNDLVTEDGYKKYIIPAVAVAIIVVLLIIMIRKLRK